jgi:hypothetical protein
VDAGLGEPPGLAAPGLGDPGCGEAPASSGTSEICIVDRTLNFVGVGVAPASGAMAGRLMFIVEFIVESRRTISPVDAMACVSVSNSTLPPTVIVALPSRLGTPGGGLPLAAAMARTASPKLKDRSSGTVPFSWNRTTLPR